MKNTLTKFNYLLLFTFVLLNFACKTEVKEPDLSVNGINYAMMVTGGTFPDETTYFMGSKDFPTGRIRNAHRRCHLGNWFRRRSRRCKARP